MSIFRSRTPVIEDAPVHPMAEFYPYWREARRQHYASRPPLAAPRRSAVVTMVRDEAVFLPIWLRFYSQHFAPEDIYVLDDGSTDGSLRDDGPYTRIPVEHDTVDWTWHTRVIQDHQHELLQTYDVVLTADVDEIVAPLPEVGPLREYLARFDEEFVNPMGYEVVHVKQLEPPYRPELAVLEQRGHWFANDGYDKPALATEPMQWEPGFHALEDDRMNWEPDLRLIHLHRMDYEICRARHALRAGRRWNAVDKEAGLGTHNLITRGRRFDQWFYEESGFAEIEVHIEPIPPEWRGLF